MKFQFYFPVFLLVLPSLGFDFVRESFKRVNQLSDPCDNFYRHACPLLSAPTFSIPLEYSELIRDYTAKQNDKIWKNLEFMKAAKRIKLAEVNGPPVEYILNLFERACESGQDTLPLLEMIQIMTSRTTSDDCLEEECLSSLAGDKNCTRATYHLGRRIEVPLTINFLAKNATFDPSKPFDLKALFKTFNQITQYSESKLVWVNTILDADLRDGVDLVNSFVEHMLEILLEWIEETPWVNNQGIDKALEDVAKSVRVNTNYAMALRDSLELQLDRELDFLKCSRHVSDDDILFCLLYIYSFFEPFKGDHQFFNEFNAFNRHPTLSFGFPFYHIAQNVEEMAGKLGSVGIVAGHELSHSLIEDPNQFDFRLLPTTSEEAIQCIQDQYNATCNQFKEDSCVVNSTQIDENGSDILGVQLAHRLLEKFYGPTINDVYIQLQHINVTYHQLFFYATAFTFCSGTPGKAKTKDPHSTLDIRVNVIAQHPAFRDAFQCSENSRMVKTFPEPCVVFGKNAPEQKKRRKLAKTPLRGGH